MARPAGLPKTGGRKKGTPNRRSELLSDNLNELGLDISERITELLPQLSTEKQMNALIQLLPYIFPKRKALELQTPPQPPREPTDEEVQDQVDHLVHICLELEKAGVPLNFEDLDSLKALASPHILVDSKL